MGIKRCSCRKVKKASRLCKAVAISKVNVKFPPFFLPCPPKPCPPCPPCPPPSPVQVNCDLLNGAGSFESDSFGPFIPGTGVVIIGDAPGERPLVDNFSVLIPEESCLTLTLPIGTMPGQLPPNCAAFFQFMTSPNMGNADLQLRIFTSQGDLVNNEFHFQTPNEVIEINRCFITPSSGSVTFELCAVNMSFTVDEIVIRTIC